MKSRLLTVFFLILLLILVFFAFDNIVYALDMEVITANAAPDFSTVPLPMTKVKVFEEITIPILLSSSTTRPVKYEITSGELPIGLRLDNASGMIIGTPSKAGYYYFTLKISNSFGETEREFCITIFNYSVDITFVVENGVWSNGESKITTTYYAMEKDVYLTKDMLPKATANSGYGGGAWDKDPCLFEKITEDITFTYTFFEQKRDVEFIVVNGKWQDGSSSVIKVTVDSNTEYLDNSIIPTIMTPNDGYGGGYWDKNPLTTKLSDALTTFTYVFAKLPIINDSYIEKLCGEMFSNQLTEGEGRRCIWKANNIEYPLPQGLTLSEDGVISGNCTVAGKYYVMVSATVDNVTTTKLIEIVVKPSWKITFKIQNGTWLDGSTDDKVIYVSKEITSLTQEQLPLSIPQEGYSGGYWVTQPPLGEGSLSQDMELTYRYRKIEKAKITFKVENGKWENGSKEDIVIYVEMLDGEGEIDDSLIPTGMRADNGYKNSRWNTTPKKVTGDTVFVYSFSKSTSTSQSGGGSSIKYINVSFIIFYGIWENGQQQITLSLPLKSGKAELLDELIPTPPEKEGFIGAWDINPFDVDYLTEDAVFTYSYQPIKKQTVTITFVIVNGVWADGATGNIVLTVNKGETLPMVPQGMTANEGYANGRWEGQAPTQNLIINSDTIFLYIFSPIEQTDEQNQNVAEIVTGATTLGIAGVATAAIVIKKKRKVYRRKAKKRQVC